MFLLESQVIEEKMAKVDIKEEDEQKQGSLMTSGHPPSSEDPGYLREQEDQDPLHHQGVRVVDQRSIGQDADQGGRPSKTWSVNSADYLNLLLFLHCELQSFTNSLNWYELEWTLFHNSFPF